MSLPAASTGNRRVTRLQTGATDQIKVTLLDLEWSNEGVVKYLVRQAEAYLRLSFVPPVRSR